MNAFVSEAKRLLSEVERFLVAISNKLPGSLERDRGNLLHKVSELRNKHQECLPSRKQNFITRPSPDTPPALPGRRPSNTSLSGSAPVVPPRPASTISSECDELQETYEAVDADPGFDKKAFTLPRRSNPEDQPAYLQTKYERKPRPVPSSVSQLSDDVYEPPAPAVSGESNELYLEAETHLDQDQAYYVMERANSPSGTNDDVELPPASKQVRDRVTGSSASSLTKRQSKGKSEVRLDSITNPDCVGILKRKKDKLLMGKWLQQTVVVKDNMIFIGGKDLSGDVEEFFSLSDAVIESVKIARQQHAFQIKPKLGKTVCFAAENAVEMQEWVRVLNRATSKSIVNTGSTQDPQCNQADPAAGITNDPIMDDVYEMPELEQLSELQTSGQLNEVDKDEIFIGRFHPKDQKAELQHIYKALYDCLAEGDDEVSLRRGQLILIDFKDHRDWWVGTTQTPDGRFHGKRGFVPRSFLVPAYQQL